MLLGVQEVAMQQGSVLICAEVMKEMDVLNIYFGSLKCLLPRTGT